MTREIAQVKSGLGRRAFTGAGEIHAGRAPQKRKQGREGKGRRANRPLAKGAQLEELAADGAVVVRRRRGEQRLAGQSGRRGGGEEEEGGGRGRSSR